MVDVPTPNGVLHPGVVLHVKGDGQHLHLRVVRVVRGTGNPNRRVDDCDVIDADDEEGALDLDAMGLAKTTYFYGDEFEWFPERELRVREGYCPMHVLESLRSLDPELGDRSGGA